MVSAANEKHCSSRFLSACTWHTHMLPHQWAFGEEVSDGSSTPELQGLTTPEKSNSHLNHSHLLDTCSFIEQLQQKWEWVRMRGGGVAGWRERSVEKKSRRKIDLSSTDDGELALDLGNTWPVCSPQPVGKLFLIFTWKRSSICFVSITYGSYKLALQ